MQQLMTVVTALLVATAGACTVHHHHHADEPQQIQHTGAPGQTAHGQQGPGAPIEPGYAPEAYPDYQPVEPYPGTALPYSTPPASAHSRSGHSCDCTKHDHSRDAAPPPAVAPRTFAPAGPAGPVTPRDLRRDDPADFLE